MTIESYVTDEETPLEGCTSKNWAWLVTDKRVIKYREGKGTKEQMHDVSLNEIDSVGIVRSGRDSDKLWIGAGSLVLAVVFLFFSVTNGILIIGAGLFFLVGILLLISWSDSDNSFFVLRGSGVIEDMENQWKGNIPVNMEYSETRDFVMAVRKQLNGIE